MPEYLFKALTKCGRSVEGFLVPTSVNGKHKGYAIIDLYGIDYDELDNYHPSFNLDEIIPKTICQYTGKNDRKGNRIFSNDIVRFFGKDSFDDYLIKWDEDNCRYIVIDEKGCTDEFDTFFAERCEVIFNLHNPTKIMYGGMVLVDITKDIPAMALIEKHKPKGGADNES